MYEVKVGAVEGGIFDKDVIFLFSSYAYSELKQCVQNKKETGLTSLRIDIRGCEDSDVNYLTFKRIQDMTVRVSIDTGVGLKIIQ